MKEIFRTTLRLDLDKPAERKAAELLRKQHQEQDQTYSALIASAVNVYFGGQNSDTQLFDEKQRDEIRAIVREEMATAPLSVGGLLQVLGQAPQTEPIPENNEPDDDELDDILDSFGS